MSNFTREQLKSSIKYLDKAGVRGIINEAPAIGGRFLGKTPSRDKKYGNWDNTTGRY